MAYTALQFLEIIKPMVLADMKTSGILASMTAAQALIESKHGTSGLGAAPNYNLFGIKGEYNGAFVIMPTKEWDGTKYITVKSKFRKYPSWAESIADHSAMFNRMGRYSNLRGVTDYKIACQRVKEDGYASAPDYTQTLINTIKTYHLYDWDKEVLGGAVETVKEPVNGNPYSEPTKNVRLNSKGNDVRWVQYALNKKGDYRLIVDGKFGEKTLAAVIDFQKKAFPDDPKEWDGIVGTKTRAVLKNIT